jgi:hypothetical protein
MPSATILPASGSRQAQHNIGKRGLAGAGTANDPDLLAGPDRQRDPAHTGLVCIGIGEGYAVKLQSVFQPDRGRHFFQHVV